MTTFNPRTGFCYLAIAFVAFTITPVLTQAQTEESVLGEVATTSEDLMVVTAIASSSAEIESTVTSAPWFRVEKLTGGNIDVGDFVVGPGRAEIEVKPGQSVTYEISVSNRISDNRLFEITIEDVAGSDDINRPVVLLGEQVGPYTIKDYISLPAMTFELDLGERARIPVTITVPPDAPPGGLYGSVLISTVRVEETEAGEVEAARSPIVARIGTLFFVTVPGEVEKAGETKSVGLTNKSWWYEKGPIPLTILYENTGSVHLNPYGELRITNLFGEEVGFVELEPWFALPKSLRSREVTWDRELLFGRYVAKVSVNRGYDDIVDERSVAFWVLPWKIVGGIFLVVFISLLTIRLFFRTFEFKRKK
jgi:hypothetical protein